VVASRFSTTVSGLVYLFKLFNQQFSISADLDIEKCGSNKIHCIFAAKFTLLDQMYLPCKCLPACRTISFESEVFMGKLNESISFLGHDLDLNEFEYSQMNVYFKENSFLTSQRVERYGATDFLATCGGLLGLFLGVSVISLLEIAYFCTVGLFSKLKVNKIVDDGQTVPVEYFQDFYVKKSKRCFKLLKDLMADYFTKTTIQGFNYVSAERLSWIERVWWAVVIALSTLCCSFLISSIIKQYEKSPVVISYANEETSISEVTSSLFNVESES
jgi:Amiloride-sensitive sodium channel